MRVICARVCVCLCACVKSVLVTSASRAIEEFSDGEDEGYLCTCVCVCMCVKSAPVTSASRVTRDEEFSDSEVKG